MYQPWMFFFLFFVGIVGIVVMYSLGRIAEDTRAIRKTLETNPSPAAQQALHHNRSDQPSDQ